jgi:hypothetical protein
MIQTGHHSSQVSSSDPDWYKSALYNYLSSGFADFNWEGDSKVFTKDEMQAFEKSVNKSSEQTERQKFLIVKLHNTLERLAAELMLKEDHVLALHQGLEGVPAMLHDCEVLFEAREATVGLLQKIKAREELVLTLMTSGGDLDFDKQYKGLLSLSKQILSLIRSWQNLRLPYTTFVYLGEDYTNKVHEDLAQLKGLHSHRMIVQDDHNVEIVQADLTRL